MGQEFIPSTDMLTDADLTRSSIAFLNGVEYAANKKRTEIKKSVSYSDFVSVGTETIIDGDDRALIPWCIAGDYIYATDNTTLTTTGYQGLFRSLDGISWTTVQTITDLQDVNSLKGRKDGRLYIIRNNGELHTSTDGGLTTQSSEPVTDVGLDASTPLMTFDRSPIVYPSTWNWDDNGSTIITGTYKTAGPALKLYRSPDGVTFSLVYTEAGAGIVHNHANGYHAYTGNWYSAWGDGQLINKITVSTDDGLNWADWDTNTDFHCQPIAFLDYGAQDEMLFGSDGSWLVGKMNLSDVTIEKVAHQPISNVASTSGTNGLYNADYVFDLFLHEGVYYASGFAGIPVDEGSRRCGIYTSDDRVNWQTFHSFNDDEIGILEIFGVIKGKIHVQYVDKDDNLKHGYFNPAKITSHNAVAIDGTAANLLLNSSLTSLEVNDSEWVSFGTGFTGQRTISDAFSGVACYESYNAGNNVSDPLVTPPFYHLSAPNHVAGDIIFISVAVKYPDLASNRGGSARIWLGAGDFAPKDNKMGFGGTPEWAEYQISCVVADGELGDAGLIRLDLFPISSLYADPIPAYSILMDALFIQKNVPPSRFQVGGTSRTYEELANSATHEATWTDEVIWTSFAEFTAYKASYAEQYIKTWWKDASNFIELYWDAADSKFKIRETIGGVAQTPIATTETYRIMQNQPISFFVSYDGNLRLTVATGGTIENVSGVGNAIWNSASLTHQTGNGAGDDVISGWMLGDTLYSRALTDTEIESKASTGSIATVTSRGGYRSRYSGGGR